MPAHKSAARLRAVIEAAAPRLRAISPAESAQPPAPGKWSPLELVGHLIDSASNNHQRFVRAGFCEHLSFPGYDQDAWVAAQGYASAPWDELVDLFRLFNLHLARVMEATPADALDRPRTDHALDRIAFAQHPTGEPATLAWFMADYVDHLEHHLRALPPAR